MAASTLGIGLPLRPSALGNERGAVGWAGFELCKGACERGKEGSSGGGWVLTVSRF